MNILTKIKPQVIVFDCDGPLNTFDEEFLEITRPITTQEELLALGDWDIFKLLSRDELNYGFKILAEAGFWGNLKPKQSAQTMIEELRREGHTILFCTAPWEGCKDWDNVRRDWLKKHFNAKGREDVVITSAKEFVWGDVFVDDKPANIIKWNARWMSKGSKSFLYETLSNKHDKTAVELWPRVRVIDGKWEVVTK